MGGHSVERSGARFFDENRRDRGWASRVTKRGQALSPLTVLEVIDPEPELAEYLGLLDGNRLLVQYTDDEGMSYSFRWASGYPNGKSVRIQGVLEPT